jgi:alanine dehydrogenase
MTLRIGVPREIKPGENRVSVTPDGVRALTRAGARVFVQKRAGEGSGFGDGDFAAAGAVLADKADLVWDVDLVVKVKEPLPEEFPFLSEKTALFTYLHLAACPALSAELLSKRVTAVAYETVTVEGRLPLLRPMSEVAGILAVQVGARGLEKSCGGRGVLLPGVARVPPGVVAVIGAGTAGSTAARAAAGFGADVTVLDVSAEKLEELRRGIPFPVRAVLSNEESVASATASADLVISTVLVVGEKAPLLITRERLRSMKRGAVLVDIAIDQGGTAETSRPTTHDAPYYVEEGIVHYCVANMPAAVPHTSTRALSQATLPYVLSFARLGVEGALRADAALRAGLNTRGGKVACEGVAKALGRPHVPPETLL